MPEMDGIETFEKMISMNIIDVNRTRVVALTANAIAGAKEKFLESGFSDYLTKPVLPADLNKMLLRNINEDKVIFV